MLPKKMTSVKLQHPAKTPIRTCIGCRKKGAKQSLVRLTYTESGIIEVDTRKIREGRGIYLCEATDCWEKGLKGNRLEHALKVPLHSGNATHLIEYSKRFAQNR